jgi:hypothetical protein
MTPRFLNDTNIELIVGRLRAALKQQALVIEGDLAGAPGLKLEIPFKLVIQRTPTGGKVALNGEWFPIVRRITVPGITLEDPRQESLPGLPVA